MYHCYCSGCTDVIFEQKRKRRRLYREPSVSPVIVEERLQTFSFSASSPPWLRTHSDHVESKAVSGFDDDQRSKVRFLRLLGLEQVSPSCRTCQYCIQTVSQSKRVCIESCNITKPFNRSVPMVERRYSSSNV